MLASSVLQNIRLLAFASLIVLMAGCQSTPQKVEPKFGLETLIIHGAVKFDHGTNSIIAEVAIRYQDPGQFEMVVTKAPGVTFCHVVADKDDWQIEFPIQGHKMTGNKTPGNEDLALWIESRRMIIMAVKKAQSANNFTETIHGEYESGYKFRIELSEFRKVVGQVFATRMRLTCEGCQSSIEIAVHDLK